MPVFNSTVSKEYKANKKSNGSSDYVSKVTDDRVAKCQRYGRYVCVKFGLKDLIIL